MHKSNAEKNYSQTLPVTQFVVQNFPGAYLEKSFYRWKMKRLIAILHRYQGGCSMHVPHKTEEKSCRWTKFKP